MIIAKIVFECPARKGGVLYYERFLTDTEIAALYREYGIFPCLTPMGILGFSRNEAMSSRLVLGTNAVAAIPEIVEYSCGNLPPSENLGAMVQGIERLFAKPDTFASISSNAARMACYQRCISTLIQTEPSLFAG